MIPAAFDYVRAGTVDEAISLLGEHGEDAKLLAGGHSLLPLMKLRLATPTVLIDIGRVKDLSYVRTEGDEIRVGALTRHCDVEDSGVLATEAPLLAHVAAQVGDRQIRHRGTIGGSLVLRGPAGERVVSADDFFLGFLETALAPDELLTEIRMPRAAGIGWSYQKFVKRAADWAIVGAAVLHGGDRAGVALVNMAAVPLRAGAVESALGSGASIPEAAERAAEGADPSADIHASVEFRQHLARVLVRRGLEEAATRPSP